MFKTALFFENSNKKHPQPLLDSIGPNLFTISFWKHMGLLALK